MKVLACDVDWTVSGGQPVCAGTLQNIEANQIPTGITAEDGRELTGHALGLFAIVFGLLVLKKALK